MAPCPNNHAPNFRTSVPYHSNPFPLPRTTSPPPPPYTHTHVLHQEALHNKQDAEEWAAELKTTLLAVRAAARGETPPDLQCAALSPSLPCHHLAPPYPFAPVQPLQPLTAANKGIYPAFLNRKQGRGTPVLCSPLTGVQSTPAPRSTGGGPPLERHPPAACNPLSAPRGPQQPCAPASRTQASNEPHSA